MPAQPNAVPADEREVPDSRSRGFRDDRWSGYPMNRRREYSPMTRPNPASSVTAEVPP